MEFSEKDIYESYQNLLMNGARSSDIRSGPVSMEYAEDSDVFLTGAEIHKIKSKEGKIGASDDLYHKAIINGPAEDRLVFKRRYSAESARKFTEREIEEFRESAKTVLVHDFGPMDIYHASDEDRSKNDVLMVMSAKLGGIKTVYHKVSQFIEAMRVVMDAWDILSSQYTNLYSKKELMELVAEGQVWSGAIPQPRLKGIKKYNLEKIARYIEDRSLDPEDLMPIHEEPDIFYNQEEYEESFERLFTEEEKRQITAHENGDQEIEPEEIRPVPSKYIGSSNSGKNKKHFKSLNKSDKLAFTGYTETLTQIRKVGSGATYSDYQRKAEKEQAKREVTVRYGGSWADDLTVGLYELLVEEEWLDQKAAGSERGYTNRDHELSEFFRMMESFGMNVKKLRENMNMSEGQLDEKDMRLAKKRNKAAEAAIISRVIALNKDPKFKKFLKKVEDELENGKKN
jgi:DNA-binding transcriptional MerR regulator